MKKKDEYFGNWFFAFCVISLMIFAVTIIFEQWFFLTIYILICALFLSFAIVKIEPVRIGIVLRLGRRVVLGYDAEGNPVEYLTKAEGYRIIDPFTEKIVQVSLKLHVEEINAQTGDESGTVALVSAESFITNEGVHLIPEIVYGWKVSDPIKVFELANDLDRNGESMTLHMATHDMIISGARNILGSKELKEILSRVIKDNGTTISIGDKVKQDTKDICKEQLGVSIEFIRIEDIRPEKDAQDVIDYMEAVKKEEIEREQKRIHAEAEKIILITGAEATFAQRQKEAEGIRVTADAERHKREQQASAEATYLNAQIAAFVGKAPKDLTSEDGQKFAEFQIGLERAKSLATNTKVIVTSNDNIAGAISGLSNILAFTKPESDKA